MTHNLPAEQWEGISTDEWRQRWGVPALEVFTELGSTNDQLRARAESGAPQGTVVIADLQTAGRGRSGSSWHAAAGKSLLISYLIRPRANLPSLGPLPLRVAIAVMRALKASHVEARWKWPNDLTDNQQRKLCGILCEASFGPDPFVVVGIGINVSQDSDDFPSELRDASSSIRLAGGLIDRSLLAGSLIRELAEVAGNPERLLTESELAVLENAHTLAGREITVDARPRGRVVAVAKDGALIVESDGQQIEVRSGTVRALEMSR